MRYEDDVQLESPLTDAWALPQSEPTNLIAAWPQQEEPTLALLLTAMERYFGEPATLLDELETDAPEIKWTAAIRLPAAAGSKHPVMFWVEPARPGADDPPAVAGCRWVIGVETLLDPDDPLTAYHNLMRAVAGPLRNVPAILDINTSLWRDRRELHRDYFSGQDVEPPIDTVWTIQAVQQQGGGSQSMTWLHTHGLWRCGLPELEMLEVPATDVPAAAMLLNDIAEMIFEQRPAQPGEVYAIGADLAVCFQPWEAVAPYVAEGVPGGVADREGPHNRAHAGVRAVVCSTEPQGSYRQVWTWPQRVIRTLQSGQAALFMTARASARQAQLAALHWPDFLRAFNARNDAEKTTLLVKAAFAIDARGGEQREHLWIDVTSADNVSVEGTLLNQPVGDLPLQRGQQVRADAKQVSDWQVQISNATFGPDTAEAMVKTLQL